MVMIRGRVVMSHPPRAPVCLEKMTYLPETGMVIEGKPPSKVAAIRAA